MKSSDSEAHDIVRLDKWLWAARFFKTRSLAAEAVSGGKVHVNGQRCKPSRELKPGDQVTITKDQYTWSLTVSELNKQRRPAKEAATLYEESPESVEQRQEQIATRKQQQALFPQAEHKPNKKQRRQIHRFKQNVG